MAVVKAVKHFKPYLYGRPFKHRTDHADALSRKCKECRQCEIITQRDGGPSHAELTEEELAKHTILVE